MPHSQTQSCADIPGQVYLLAGLTKTLKTFLWEAFSGVYGEGCEPNCIYDNYANIGFLSEEVPRAIWLWFVKPHAMQGDGNFLHPVPLQVMIAQQGECFDEGFSGVGEGVVGSTRVFVLGLYWRGRGGRGRVPSGRARRRPYPSNTTTTPPTPQHQQQQHQQQIKP